MELRADLIPPPFSPEPVLVADSADVIIAVVDPPLLVVVAVVACVPLVPVGSAVFACAVLFGSQT
jgi:hypothetical protein